MAGPLDEQAIRLRLLRLALLFGGEVMLKDLKPGIDSPTRTKLEAEGLLEPDCFSRSPQGRRVRWLKLTDRGWRWLADKFAGDVRSNAQCGRELSAVLGMLRDFLERDGLTFGELVGRHSVSGGFTPPAVAMVRDACLRIQSRQQSQRVRLAAVRAELPTLTRTQCDEAILQLTRAGEATLYRMDDPLEIQPGDHDAAFQTSTGEKRHLIYLRGAR